MASFTDLIPQFNPYIQQLPVEAMVSVGMEKQKRYDEGLQRIQSKIEQVAGISVMRPVDKVYLQSKLNELGNNLKGVAAGDFSNFQLVNSVGGMVGQISKDPFVMAAIKSTAIDQKEAEFMETDRKAGKLTPQNELNYTKQRSAYLQSGLKDENGNPIVFSGRYNPHFDYWKFAKETFDAIKPDGISFDQVYETDINGVPKTDKNGNPIYSPVMVRYEKEGIFPQKVKDTLTQIFSDPRVSQQLQIDGEYNYRGFDGNGLAVKVRNDKDKTIAFYEDQIAELSLKLSGTDDSKVQTNIQENIEKYQRMIDEAEESYGNLERMAFENPDAIRGLLYKDEVSKRYTTMFGQLKEKTLQMDNPGWNANFKLMQEANEQSRWAQEFAFNKRKHADDMAWKYAEFQQRERLEGAKARKGAAGAGGGIGGQPELANVPSNFDIVSNTDSDYARFANEFVTASDDFLWETVFSKVPANIAKLDNMMKNGNTREQSIALLINNAAAKNKQTPEAYRLAWSQRAEQEMNKLRAANKVPHDLNDAYRIYSNAKRNFEAQSAIKQNIDEATERNIGASAAKAIQTGDIKPQKIKLEGKDYNLSREDIVDLAVYLKGYQSSLGFLVDDGVRRAGKAAAKRLEARGNKPLLEALLRTEGMWTGGPVTFFTRALTSPLKNITEVFSPSGADRIDFGQVMKVYKMIDNEEYAQGMKVKADIIRNAYGIRPNLKMGLLTGDAETDKQTVYDLRRMAGAYNTGQAQNLSYDFSDFSEGIKGDLADLAIETQVIMDANNNPQIEIVAYDSDGKRKGGMTIQPDEAASLGIDINTLYEPKEVGVLKNLMSRKNNKTSAGDPKLTSTYMAGDSWFKKDDLPGMKNTPFDVQVNFSSANGLYYGHIYVNDGSNSRVKTTPGVGSLTELYNNIITNTTPPWAKAILTTK